MTEARTYPTPDSLGAEVYSATLEGLERRFGLEGPLKAGVGPVELQLTEHVAGKAMQMVGKARGELPPGMKLVGGYSAALHVDVLAGGPSLFGRPSIVVLTYYDIPLPGLLGCLEQSGFPVPDMDPTYVQGLPEGGVRTTSYVPGPPGLCSLSYTALQEELVMVSIYSDQPPEPEFSEQVARSRAIFDWPGIMWFESEEQVMERKGTLCPRGDPLARSIVYGTSISF